MNYQAKARNYLKMKINFTILHYVTSMLIDSTLCYRFPLKYYSSGCWREQKSNCSGVRVLVWVFNLLRLIKWVLMGINVTCRDVIKIIPNLQIETSTEKEENKV